MLLDRLFLDGLNQDDIPLYIEPKHVIAGFTLTCINDHHVRPYFREDIQDHLNFFKNLLTTDSDSFGNPETDPIRFRLYFERVGYLLTYPASLSITNYGRPHFQANMLSIDDLAGLPHHLKAIAKEFGSDFYKRFICDEFGRAYQTTGLKEGDMKSAFFRLG